MSFKHSNQTSPFIQYFWIRFLNHNLSQSKSAQSISKQRATNLAGLDILEYTQTPTWGYIDLPCESLSHRAWPESNLRIQCWRHIYFIKDHGLMAMLDLPNLSTRNNNTCYSNHSHCSNLKKKQAYSKMLSLLKHGFHNLITFLSNL